jgi:hypothetical protein
MAPFVRADKFGRKTIAGAAEWLTARRQRRITHGLMAYRHRVKNGFQDPFSFWHVVHALLNIRPDEEFGAKQLADFLNKNYPAFIWDAVTVGRILNDIIESVEMVNGMALDMQPLIYRRTSYGNFYQTTNQTPANAVLRNLLDDLELLCDKLVTQEQQGITPLRLGSPLMACPSVMAA